MPFSLRIISCAALFIYSDDTSVNTRTQVGIERREVTADSVFKTELSKQGGVAIRLVSKN